MINRIMKTYLRACCMLHVLLAYKLYSTIVVHFNVELKKRPQSWASTPDIDDADDSVRGSSRSAGKSSTDDNNVDVTLKLPVPPRRHTTILDIKEVSLNDSSADCIF